MQIDPSVMIATPSYDGRAPFAFTHSLLDTVHELGAAGVPYLFVDLSGCCYTERARDVLASAFLHRTDCTHLLFIDADMRWPGRAVVEILSARVSVIAGAYMGRKPPHTWHVQALEGWNPGASGLVQVARAGTGFMLIARQVIEQLAKSADSYSEEYAGEPLTIHRIFRTGVDAKGWLTEDWAFCDDARAAGFNVYVDTTITLGHLGDQWVTGDVERMAKTFWGTQE